MSLGSCNRIPASKADTVDTEKYARILSSQKCFPQEIESVSVCTRKDLELEHLGSHSERITITFKNNGEKNGRTHHPPVQLFVKKRLPKRNSNCPACPSLDRHMTRVILNEGIFLTKFVGEMKEFCRLYSNDGTDNLVADLFPHSLYCDDKLIIMENLRERGYKVLDKDIPHDFNHAKLVIKNLARFHSTTHTMIQADGGRELFLKSHPNFENVLLNPELMHFFSRAFEAAFDNSLKILKNTENNADIEQKSKFLAKYQGHLEQTILDVLNCECLLVCVCHANLCRDNVMFSLQQNNNEGLVFVDFQTSKVCSPNIDLGYYFFRSVDHVARQHWQLLLHIYFEELQKGVESLGQTLGFSFMDFLRDFQRKCELGFIFSVFLAPGADANERDVNKISQDIYHVVDDYLLFTKSCIDDKL